MRAGLTNREELLRWAWTPGEIRMAWSMMMNQEVRYRTHTHMNTYLGKWRTKPNVFKLSWSQPGVAEPVSGKLEREQDITEETELKKKTKK